MKSKNCIIWKPKGITLLEVIISLSIIATIFAVILPLFKNIHNSWASKQTGAEAVQNARVVMDFLNRHLAAAIRITNVSGPAETDGFIEFEDNTGTTIRCEIGANNYVQFGPVGNLADLAGPVSQLQFTCYDAYDLDTPIIAPDNIRSVKVVVVLPNAGPGQDINFTTQAYLRTNYQPLGVSVSDDITVSNNAVINGDVGAGGSITTQEGGEINGSTEIFTGPLIFPTITEPDLGSSVGALVYSSGTKTISSDIRCDSFELLSSATVKISGDITILADGLFVINNSAKLKLQPFSTLTLYTKSKLEINNSAEVNCNTADSSRFIIYHLNDSSEKTIHIKNESEIHATIIAPDGLLDLTGYAELHGSYMGESIFLDNKSKLYAPSDSNGWQLRP